MPTIRIVFDTHKQHLEEVRLAGVEETVIGPAGRIELGRLALREHLLGRLHQRTGALVVQTGRKQILDGALLKSYMINVFAHSFEINRNLRQRRPV